MHYSYLLVVFGVLSCLPPSQTGLELERLPQFPSDSGSLTLDKTAYSPGETVVLALQNKLPNPLGYNLCYAQLRNSDERRVDDQHGTTCQAIMLKVNGGMVVNAERPIPEDLPAGNYRYWTSVEVDDARAYRIQSEVFQILR